MRMIRPVCRTTLSSSVSWPIWSSRYSLHFLEQTLSLLLQSITKGNRLACEELDIAAPVNCMPWVVQISQGWSVVTKITSFTSLNFSQLRWNNVSDIFLQIIGYLKNLSGLKKGTWEFAIFPSSYSPWAVGGVGGERVPTSRNYFVESLTNWQTRCFQDLI